MYIQAYYMVTSHPRRPCRLSIESQATDGRRDRNAMPGCREMLGKGMCCLKAMRRSHAGALLLDVEADTIAELGDLRSLVVLLAHCGKSRT